MLPQSWAVTSTSGLFMQRFIILFTFAHFSRIFCITRDFTAAQPGSCAARQKWNREVCPKLEPAEAHREVIHSQPRAFPARPAARPSTAEPTRAARASPCAGPGRGGAGNGGCGAEFGADRARRAEPRPGGRHAADGQAEPGGAAAGRAVPQLRPAGRRRGVLPAAAGAGAVRRAGGGPQVRPGGRAREGGFGHTCVPLVRFA